MTDPAHQSDHPGLPPTTGAAALALGAELIGPDDLSLRRLDTMDRSCEGTLTFIRSAPFAAKWPECQATAVIASRDVDVPRHADRARAVLVVDDADAAVRTLLGLISARVNPPVVSEGVHPSAFVDASANVDPAATVGPFCFVGPDAELAPGALLEAGVTVGANCKVGARTRIQDGVVLRPFTTVGADCLLHPGTVVGADGFGFDRDADNIPQFIPHIAGVTIGDRVVIGANCAIDRGKFSDTVIGDDVKIDNLTQIGHNCRIDQAVVICGCCAIGGSTHIGAFSTLGGGVHLGDNTTVEPGAMLAGGTFANGILSATEPWVGHPARPKRIWLNELRGVKNTVRMRQELKDAMKTIARLEARLESLEGDG
ncbi:MAG: UDP-3-O-(3-hydroxymyristoyl)glucosamine N-acyltransferase [Planctomycetota bacterium]